MTRWCHTILLLLLLLLLLPSNNVLCYKWHVKVFYLFTYFFLVWSHLFPCSAWVGLFPRLSIFNLTSVATHWRFGAIWFTGQMPFLVPNQAHQVCKETWTNCLTEHYSALNGIFPDVWGNPRLRMLQGKAYLPWQLWAKAVTGKLEDVCCNVHISSHLTHERMITTTC